MGRSLRTSAQHGDHVSKALFTSKRQSAQRTAAVFGHGAFLGRQTPLRNSPFGDRLTLMRERGYSTNRPNEAHITRREE